MLDAGCVTHALLHLRFKSFYAYVLSWHQMKSGLLCVASGCLKICWEVFKKYIYYLCSSVWFCFASWSTLFILGALYLQNEAFMLLSSNVSFQIKQKSEQIFWSVCECVLSQCARLTGRQTDFIYDNSGFEVGVHGREDSPFVPHPPHVSPSRNNICKPTHVQPPESQCSMCSFLITVKKQTFINTVHRK